jgi:hypothetical protein
MILEQEGWYKGENGRRTSGVVVEGVLCRAKGLRPDLCVGGLSSLRVGGGSDASGEGVEEDGVESARRSIHVDLDLEDTNKYEKRQIWMTRSRGHSKMKKTTNLLSDG